ncbi:XdhC family protein [Sulfitobacter mediterraneus]|uniref:XdhC family protein n=1 Tax=Sulfitobacter mediterraneus TaxID=83219 RepID=UPI00193A649A|nr:XdhC family protein [Sulfitobacter mediterraneus]MBM1556847.1 XdhC family protein [Sulfitobacter mediterraneus]MBM1569032.1 XdhC family protein [Sulfitobacter mediterraneus]MBM1572459.1 XdhC family protein [Sulfitobacter mediterraneus]MBM1576622.1 XdhC family protein [Sulfitobacter mediterraneus]MBM1579805.1 XdhC family protein [Sulfitobacter mediterraneus]
MQNRETAPEQALRWVQAGEGAALATVIETWGSAPRRVGAQLVVSGTGAMEGSVSGGCVEGAVVIEALEALQEGASRMLEYGVSDGDAFAVGLACGGTIRVLVEPIGAGGMPVNMLADLVAARAARRPVAYEAALNGSTRKLVTEGHAERFRADRSGLSDDGKTFIAIHNPPLRMAIVGGVHIAQHLDGMARAVGFDTYIIDPREAFGSEARFPGAQVINEWPDDALQNLGVDARTALVLLTHDPKLDDPAIQCALASGPFYIGALGSSRTHAARRARLAEAGFKQDQIAQIHGPVGLDIGASGPAEIAVSIMAEVIQTLRQA